jgi:carbonic anhydrase
MPIQQLIEGVHHFQGRAFHAQQELFTRLADGQSPETLFITCSDSRIDPNLITHTDPGDLFVLRNAGNLIPAFGGPSGGEVATIEFALAGLDVRNIVVCGHSHCGAMQGLLTPEVLTDMPAVAEFLKHAEATRRIVRAKYQHLSGNDLLEVTIEENVLVQIEALQTHPAVAAALSQGLLSLHAWVYDIATGGVYAYDTDSNQFVPLLGVRPEGQMEQPDRLKDIRSGDARFRGQGRVGK